MLKNINSLMGHMWSYSSNKKSKTWKKKRRGLIFHAKERFMERYGIGLTPKLHHEIVNLINAGNANEIVGYKTDKDRKVYKVVVPEYNEKVACVFDPKYNCLVTALHRKWVNR